jgi:hypothetical protein
MSDLNDLCGDFIYSYTRRQAIDDGVLVDLSQFAVVRKHWKLHMACTDAVWGIIDHAVKHERKEIEGVLHDISVMAMTRIGRDTGGTLYFDCIIGTEKRSLKLHCGPGDTAVPVLTLMLPNED